MGITMCKMKATVAACDAPTSTAAWQSYLLPDEVLQHRALPCALAAHHGDLRQVQVGVLADGGEGILHTVHQRNQILHSPVPHVCSVTDRLSPVSKKRDLFLIRLIVPPHRSRVQGAFCAVLTPVRVSACSLIDCASSDRSPPSNTSAPSAAGGRRRLSCVFSGEIPAVSRTHRSVVTMVHFRCSAPGIVQITDSAPRTEAR